MGEGRGLLQPAGSDRRRGGIADWVEVEVGEVEVRYSQIYTS